MSPRRRTPPPECRCPARLVLRVAGRGTRPARTVTDPEPIAQVLRDAYAGRLGAARLAELRLDWVVDCGCPPGPAATSAQVRASSSQRARPSGAPTSQRRPTTVTDSTRSPSSASTGQTAGSTSTSASAKTSSRTRSRRTTAGSVSEPPSDHAP